MKMMAGCICLLAEKRARTSFSPSPTNLEVRVEALKQLSILRHRLEALKHGVFLRHRVEALKQLSILRH